MKYAVYMSALTNLCMPAVLAIGPTFTQNSSFLPSGGRSHCQNSLAYPRTETLFYKVVLKYRFGSDGRFYIISLSECVRFNVPYPTQIIFGEDLYRLRSPANSVKALKDKMIC